MALGAGRVGPRADAADAGGFISRGGLSGLLRAPGDRRRRPPAGLVGASAPRPVRRAPSGRPRTGADRGNLTV